jgi:Ca2+-binding RTX toxin-like protein
MRHFLANLFGVRSVREAESRKVRPAVEALEGRSLMATGILFNADTGLITIEGSNGNDKTLVYVDTQGTLAHSDDLIGVKMWAGNGTYHEVLLNRYAAVQTPNGVVFKDQLKAIHFFGLDGNDRFLNSSLDIDCLAEGGAGNDVLLSAGGRDSLVGGAGTDNLTAGEGNDYLDGGEGDDDLYGGLGADLLYAGDGADLLKGGAGDDLLNGQEGNDILMGEEGNDILIGGLGVDGFNGGPGVDQVLP